MMKSLLRYLIPAAGLAVALPALRAEEPAEPKIEKKEMRVIVGPEHGTGPSWTPRHAIRVGEPREMESVTFIGIAAFPADATLADQLNLPKGVGLVVREIAPNSPASAALKTNDVLVKLDDQLLIEQRQLAVLVRNHKEGDEVTLTLFRGGKEITAKVKLAKHDAPKLSLESPGPGRFFQTFELPPGMDNVVPGAGREDMDRLLALIDRGAQGRETRRIHIDRDDTPGMHTTTVNTSNSNMVFSDEQGSLDLTIKDGQKTLVAKDAKGTQLFSGPVNTPEERKTLPPAVRERLDKVEGMQEFSFQTDDDFQGGDVQVVKPKKTKIRQRSIDSDRDVAPQPPPF